MISHKVCSAQQKSSNSVCHLLAKALHLCIHADVQANYQLCSGCADFPREGKMLLMVLLSSEAKEFLHSLNFMRHDLQESMTL